MKKMVFEVSTWCTAWLCAGAIEKWSMFRLVPTVTVYTHNGWRRDVCVDLTWLFWGVGFAVKRRY
jgi:hypothetical protein